jgi:uncharacterized cupredoxin-like copper-binding protein
MKKPTQRPALVATGALLAAASLLAACGSDDKESSDSTKPKAVALTLSQSGKKFSLKAPSSVDGGLAKVTLTNTGKVPADAQLVRVEGNHSQAEVVKIVDSEGAPIPEWLRAAGGPATAAPGKSRTSTEVLPAGTYYALSTGDTSGKSIAALGGVAKFTVKGGDSSAKLPSTSATIDAKEYSFSTSGLKAGKSTVTFNNKGKELHHAILLPMNKGATLDDVKKFATSNGQPSGPPPVDFEKGDETTVIDGGSSQVTQVDLHKGKYAVLCFISDRKGGPPHVAKGMLDEVTVK